MKIIPKKLRNFWRDETGTAVIEAIIIFPILTWAFVAMTVYFDAFRVRSVNLKAAYTISDLISRENPIVDADYIDGLKTTFDFLTASNNPTWIRVTLVRFNANDPDDPGDDEHIVDWSWGTGPASPSPYTDASIITVEDRIPVMGNGDTVILVETHLKYDPSFDIGFNSHNFDNFIVTRPRVGPPCWETCIN